MNVLLLGPIGSGKGTIADIICKQKSVPHISMGQLLRDYMAEKGPLTEEINSYMSKGVLVPSEITDKILKERLAMPDCAKGFVLEGYPRDKGQLETLEKHTRIDAVLLLVVPMSIMLDRLSGRLTCSKCGAIYHERTMKPKKAGLCDLDGASLAKRQDDLDESALKQRFEVFRTQTSPVLDHYRKKGLVHEIDASPSIHEGNILIDNVTKVINEIW